VLSEQALNKIYTQICKEVDFEKNISIKKVTYIIIMNRLKLMEDMLRESKNEFQTIRIIELLMEKGYLERDKRKLKAVK